LGGQTESGNATIRECLQPIMQPDPDRVGKKRIAKKPVRPKRERNSLYFFQVVLEDDPIDVRGSPIAAGHLWVSGGLAKATLPRHRTGERAWPQDLKSMSRKLWVRVSYWFEGIHRQVAPERPLLAAPQSDLRR
jgi:hypothetical protein